MEEYKIRRHRPEDMISNWSWEKGRFGRIKDDKQTMIEWISLLSCPIFRCPVHFQGIVHFVTRNLIVHLISLWIHFYIFHIHSIISTSYICVKGRRAGKNINFIMVVHTIISNQNFWMFYIQRPWKNIDMAKVITQKRAQTEAPQKTSKRKFKQPKPLNVIETVTILPNSQSQINQN